MPRRKTTTPDLDRRPPAAIRADLEAKLRAEGRDDLADKLAHCAEVMHITCVCCGKSRPIEKGCKRRWCPVCAPRITAARMMRLESVVARFQWPLAVTLTMENVQMADGALDVVKERFRKFRETVFWERNVKGGVVGFEVTNRGNGFHPHLHALVDCEWLAVSTPRPTRRMAKKAVAALCERAQDELSEVWGAYVQGRKAMVWVNRAWGNSMMETLKYAIKPSDLLADAVEAGELIDIIDAGRMISSFGHAHASSKSFVGRDLPEENLTECEQCGGFKTVLPADILDMYQRRPDLASARFHQLMSLAGNYDDHQRPWEPMKTMPKHVPKGFSPSRKRQVQEPAGHP